MPALRPNALSPSEYDAVYQKYIDLLPDRDLWTLLDEQADTVRSFLQKPSTLEKADYRYAPGKWSLKEVAGHVIDNERVFAYRALRFSRGDTTALPGYDHDAYVAAARFSERPLVELADAFYRLRKSNLDLFRGFDASMLQQTGTANGTTASVRALLHITAGHTQHHLNVIRERYV